MSKQGLVWKTLDLAGTVAVGSLKDTFNICDKDPSKDRPTLLMQLNSAAPEQRSRLGAQDSLRYQLRCGEGSQAHI